MNYDNEKFKAEFIEILKKENPEKILFVASSEYDRYGYRKAIDDAGFSCVSFTDFEPCPEISSVNKGVEIFNFENCDFIATVGGGSAMDTAKGIKYYSQRDVKILAVPTTAGTGAEVTRFAVLYNNADKQSVRSYDIIPEYQVFDYTSLKTLPYTQKVVTALDAFCHSVEAYWSLNATDESRDYSVEALELFSDNFEAYLKDDKNAYEPMMKCSELAGRAINIAQTTSPHAFSYKLHKLKGFYHGQAVAVCLAYIWKYMLENCKTAELEILLAETEIITGFTPDTFISFLEKYHLTDNLEMTQAEFDETVKGVNIDRLSNNPTEFTGEDIEAIYSSFIKIK
ncbi:MAG: iron-containing alcohol dehydrogenase [Eubacterium sp.]